MSEISLILSLIHIYSILQGVLAVVELVVSHTEAFALHHLIHSVRQVVNCPHSLVSGSGVDSAERHDRGDKDRLQLA